MSKDSQNKIRGKDSIEEETIKHTANYTTEQMMENLNTGELPKTEQELLNKLYGGRAVTTKRVLTAKDDFNMEEWENAIKNQDVDLYKIVGMNKETVKMLGGILLFYFIGIDKIISYGHDEVQRLEDFRDEILENIETTEYINKPKRKRNDRSKWNSVSKEGHTRKDSTADAVIRSSLKKYEQRIVRAVNKVEKMEKIKEAMTKALNSLSAEERIYVTTKYSKLEKTSRNQMLQVLGIRDKNRIGDIAKQALNKIADQLDIHKAYNQILKMKLIK